MTAAAKPDVRTERRANALWVWIDRESRRNAFNAGVLAGIEAAVELASTDASIRALVLTGAGEKAFCAGADLADGTKTFQATPEEPRERRLRRRGHGTTGTV